MKKCLSTGFSLVELIAVMAVISLIFALSMSAFSSVKRSSGLTLGMTELVGELSRARQVAITKNRAVEVRFYRDESGPVADQHYRAYQFFEYSDEGTAIAVGKMKWLSGDVILDSNETLSTMLAAGLQKNWDSATDPQPVLPKMGLNYSARAFRFRPNGSADLSMSSSQWFVTLHSWADGDNLTTLPPNYATIQLDPVNGLVRSYRP